MNLTTAEKEELASGFQNIGIFFRLDVDPPVRIWLGFGDIRPGVNVLDPTGATYHGFGEIAAVPAVKQMINGAAERVEFSLSGVEGEVLELAAAHDAEAVKGKRVSVGFAVMDAAWQLVGPVRWIRHYTADFLTIQQQPTDDPATPIIRTLSLSCGSLMTTRRRPALGYFTNQDQQRRSPGDRFCERTPKYAPGFNKTWPRYS